MAGIYYYLGRWETQYDTMGNIIFWSMPTSYALYLLLTSVLVFSFSTINNLF